MQRLLIINPSQQEELIIYTPCHPCYGMLTYIWLKFMVNVGKYIYHTWMLWDIRNIHVKRPLADMKTSTIHESIYGKRLQ